MRDRIVAKLEMALHAVGVDGDAQHLQFSEQFDQFLPLARLVAIVVVVDQQRVRIVRASRPKRGNDEVHTCRARVDGVSQQIAFAVPDRFVHDIPHGCYVGVPPDDRSDVCLYTPQHCIARYRFTIFLHHPRICPVILGPHEAVPDHLKPISASEVGETIGRLKGPFVFGRMDALRLHAVLRRDNLEVLLDQGGVFRILQHVVPNADPDLEAIADGLLQGATIGGFGSSWDESAHSENQRERDNKRTRYES